jgi:Protein of unknown function (DUF1254)
MRIKEIGVYGYLRRVCLASALTAGLAMTAGVSAGVAQVPVDPDAIAGNAQAVSQLSPFNTTVAYVAQFYPLWFTYYQRLLGTPNTNRLIGPDRVSPIYHYAVAVNVDTLYASSFLNLSAEPVVVTIPTTPSFPSTNFSILMLDPYGDLLPASASIPKTPGSYALIGPGGFTGTLPPGVTPITLPLNYSFLAFRADKFVQQADAFRRALKSQTLSDYLKTPPGGRLRSYQRSSFPYLSRRRPTTSSRMSRSHSSGSSKRPLQPALRHPSLRTKKRYRTGSTACLATGI